MLKDDGRKAETLCVEVCKKNGPVRKRIRIVLPVALSC